MDLKNLSKKVETLEKWQDALQAQDRISDSDRRDLVKGLIKGKLGWQDKEQALALAMGSLGGMQNMNRCYQWWSVVAGSPEAIRAARKQGLPFAAGILGLETRWDFIKRAIEKGRPQCAWLLWSHACSPADRQSLLSTVLDAMGRKMYEDIEGNDLWMRSLAETVSIFPLPKKHEFFANLLCDRMTFLIPGQPGTLKSELSSLVPWFFPEGVNHDEVRAIEIAIGKRCSQRVPVRIDQLDEIMAPWIALHSRLSLDSATPSHLQSLGSRRL